jgi:Tfp pilus assembly protein PilF
MMRVLTAVFLVALAGCGTEPARRVQEFFNPTPAQKTLSAGLRQYEEGQYNDSLKSLHSAIQQGLDERDRVTAYKHIAFIHCASNRVPQCRDEFRKALAVDPAMNLEPEEAGHPVWGPIFRSVKAGR